ncbi:pseudaminic acid cytidylyltransferase [Bacteroides thetaiotaomicron]|jgi:pseudaminic acid cytidylyltransferase|uniref:pseudaminic acid cytidylyltransferase n=1 Tax=Bacteroides thetaiotaomicron TaxID=818 RepID=UPI0018A00648|nr:pseudaminic acid cytidylyltransferase [Bacteroides thetaiotaomicron]MCE9018151.1 pseudaminic acid cytidylyltransferase [Bacteroides thetaiotaomicron]MCS2395892.1 pseudaminic acid cytidylyltransferase [Bacteroides thetaiotaomicron]MDC2007622.1 pseudaminic acid cytidylyltransferase [Bacteroides thetaiotaomicron]MDC2022331.1 pseudaminic acid cytidylyltransferase [Bacteroides thetaiotaomicron]MDC2024608.1 pseudaminic acid cytidylyltransferase [Bacteroides thetaiotaomicron]
MSRVLCIIPARGGSKRIPHKNIALFKGKPIISYSIQAVIESGIADEVMVSTDDEEIAKISKQYGAKIPFFRSKETSNDYVGVADVLVEVVNDYKKIGEEFDYVLCVFATDPLLQTKNLKLAYEQLCNSSTAESISTIEVYSYPPQRGMIIRENGEMQMLHPENYSARSQDLQKIYHDSCQFFLFKTYALLRDKKLYTKHTLPFIINELESQDIDTIEDWKIAELKYDLLCRKK